MARSLLHIPDDERPTLARLVNLPPEHHAAISAALRDAHAEFSITTLARQVSEKTGIGLDEVDELLQLLAMLYRVRDRERSAAGEFLSEVEKAAKETRRADLTEPQVNWGEARQRIGELLGHGHSLGVTAKAVDVLTEHERMFCGARVLSDVRPVFTADVRDTPDAFVLVHELRISYHQGRKIRAVYVAMDPSDLRELREVINRAVDKEQGLESLAAKSGVPVLRVRSHGG